MNVEDRFVTATVNTDQLNEIREVTEVILATARWLDHTLPDGRYKSLVLTALEEAEVWAHKSIVRDAK